MLFQSLVLAASALLASSAIVSPLTSPQPTLPPILPLPILGDYKNLYDRCINDSPDAYVAVRYQDGSYVQFHYNECYPYSYPDRGLAQVAVFCRAVTCYNNPNPNCTGGAVPPVPIPLPPLTVLPNAADWVQLLGQGATCQQNGLSGL